MGHQFFFFLTLICIPGLCAVTLVPSQNPVAVGSNVTIRLSDPININVGSWVFRTGTLFIWVLQEIYPGSSHQAGIDLNITTYQLTLSSVTLNSSGVYVLEALSPSKTKAEITLDVQEPVSKVTADVSKTNLVEFNDTVMFTCNASGTSLRFSWQNGSAAVTAGGRVQLSNNGQNLIISGVTRYDEGPFKCIVVNDISMGESIQMNLTISYGPSNLRITASPDNMTFASGLPISLSCSVESKPTASLYWMYNGKPLNVFSSSYNLTDTTENGTGLYTCVAQNEITLRSAEVSKTIRIVDPISAVAVNPSGSPIEHMPFNLSCNVVGPVDSIQWMKNDMDLYADNTITFFNGNSTLSFKNLALSHDGLYQCVASNAVSNIRQAYNLMVNYGPINTTASGPNVAKVGSNVTFSCSSVSRPQSQYSWYFSDSKVADEPVYVTAALRQNNSGQYTCMAFNNITGISSNASVQLTVLAPVTNVMVNMEDQQPIFNQSFTLTCTASGDVEHIQWMKNGMFLSPENGITLSNDNSILTFQNLSLNDDGHYQCEASNAVSNSTSNAYDLMVNYGPWNQKVEGPLIAGIGSSVTFNCTAVSRPQSQYIWYHNSSKVGDGPVYVTTVLSLNDSGQYTCMAFNNITGSSSNASVQLTLKYPVSDVIVNAGSQHPIFNQSFTLTCTASGDVEHIQWMKNGMFLSPENGITLSNDNSTLTFQNLSLNDDGHYQCEASNAVSNSTSNAYDLMVNYGPWNQKVEGPLIAGIGSNVTFNCTAVSRPQSQYIWYHNSSKVGDGPVYVTSALSLNDSGQYTCMAFNNITGSSNASVQLTVIEPITSVVVTPDRLIPLASQSLQLKCDVIGHYNKIQWLRGNQNFQQSDGVTFSGDNTTVTFKYLKTADDGQYKCIATNSLKEHVSEPYGLVVIFGPQSVQIIVRPGIPTKLTCQALSQPPAEYHWIENNTVVGNQSTIEVPIKYILGSNYTCVAKNPLTNVTVYTSQVVNDPNAAVSVHASVLLTALIALLLPVLEQCL
ncbi:carcinoembryonic antigen-related cell adhesion molecule 1 [Siphateles boraxobius]|uniref:carcinoembryonic antigen-related cell adhesion molecule 1 n=1 Tax=Siphateles boraxobius TaxID=180520 RepID=UPI004063C09E